MIPVRQGAARSGTCRTASLEPCAHPCQKLYQEMAHKMGALHWEAKLQQRDPEAVYPENDEFSWQWDQINNRLKYEQMRVDSDQAYSRAVLMIGVIVVNHIVSGIDAIRVVRKAQRNPVQVGMRVRVEGGVDLCVSKSF